MNMVCEKITNWYKESVICAPNDGYMEVTTPFLNSHNDLITIYVIKEGNGFLLTDDGETIGGMEDYGYKVEWDFLERIARMTGCYLYNYEIRVKATENELGFKVNQLANAIMRISSMELAGNFNVKGI